MPSPPAIRVTHVSKRFGSTLAVDDASVVVPRGSVVALLGPSGSGKTSLLRMIAGFEVPDQGSIHIGDREVAGDGVWLEPEVRRVGMVFQDGALFPHLTVARNVGFGEPAPGRVEECLDLVGLGHRADAYPHELSGGERQRIALARALAPEPDVVLLDEPFAALDATLRVALREQVAAILRTAGATSLFVTHDQTEALSLADEVVLMCEGRVVQAGPPEEVYAQPASTWAAEFLGAADVVPGTVDADVVRCEIGAFAADTPLDGDVSLVIRPEHVRITAAPADVDGSSPGGDGEPSTATVVSRSFFGHDQLVSLRLPSGRRLHSRTTGAVSWRPGDVVRVDIDGPIGILPPR